MGGWGVEISSPTAQQKEGWRLPKKSSWCLKDKAPLGCSGKSSASGSKPTACSAHPPSTLQREAPPPSPGCHRACFLPHAQQGACLGTPLHSPDRHPGSPKQHATTRARHLDGKGSLSFAQSPWFSSAARATTDSVPSFELAPCGGQRQLCYLQCQAIWSFTIPSTRGPFAGESSCRQGGAPLLSLGPGLRPPHFQQPREVAVTGHMDSRVHLQAHGGSLSPERHSCPQLGVSLLCGSQESKWTRRRWQRQQQLGSIVPSPPLPSFFFLLGEEGG